MSSELLRQARKYRAVSLSLPPNMGGPQGREYYARMADELENQAREIAVATIPAASTEGAGDTGGYPPIPPQSGTHPTPAPVITLRKQTRIHANLAVAVMNDKRPNTHRAFTIWATLRQQNRTWFSKSEIIEFYATTTGKHPRHVRRWLDAGDGVFWTFGRKNRVSLIGRNRVFAGYGLAKTGRVLAVDTKQLLGKLQDLRAALYAGWLGGKNSRWAARETIRNITGVSERSQLNYDKRNQQKTQHIYAVDWRTEQGKPRQLPNRYHAVFYPAHSGHQGNTKRYGLYTLDNTNGVTSTQGQSLNAALPISGANVTVGGGRVLFDNPNRAVAAARRRAKRGDDGQCFAVIGDTRRGNLLVKTLDYAAMV